MGRPTTQRYERIALMHADTATPETIHRMTAEERRTLSGPALRGFRGIASGWQLTLQEQEALLGSEGPALLRGKDEDIGADALARISYVLGIYKVLHTLFVVPEQADRWIRAPNAAPLLDGNTALAFIADGDLGKLQALRRYLDCEMS
jgi:hypothetical protein